MDWMAANFRLGSNPGHVTEQLWKYYYLYGLERAGRLMGVRYFGSHDWYFEGAEHLVHDPNRDPKSGKWTGTQSVERDPVVTTSFVLIFLAKGRIPVLINKARHGPGIDWNNDPDDVRNLVNAVSRDWSRDVTWQIVDPETASVADLLQAPILFLNGHNAPELGTEAKKRLRMYCDRGGVILAEACCSREAFDKGFRTIMKEIFPEPEHELQLVPSDHAIWRARFPTSPDDSTLWCIEHGGRAIVIYSPQDLSCFWNQMGRQPASPEVLKTTRKRRPGAEERRPTPEVHKATRIGLSIIDYVTGGKVPPDKLSVPQASE
jgi:hypothetical protein